MSAGLMNFMPPFSMKMPERRRLPGIVTVVVVVGVVTVVEAEAEAEEVDGCSDCGCGGSAREPTMLTSLVEESLLEKSRPFTR